MGIVLFLLIGILAGWIAGKLIQGGGFGLIGNMVVGVVGAVLGGYVLGAVGIDLGGFFGQLVTAVLGALILLFGVGLVKRA
ncbi:MAG: GlsB/YeaQ/YmgE family stress response membrane protein [Geminicoccaceae bacterium]|nr:GlsB/YeaQ/YmgE family stress response membrane protein [Geminicoccaceae bacterium]